MTSLCLFGAALHATNHVNLNCRTLSKVGYWPGSISFQTVYQIDLFTSFEQFKVTAPGLSRQAFVKMLEHRSRTFGRVRMLPNYILFY